MRELSLNIMDIAQNSISAEASLIELAIEENTATGWLSIQINDNGRGMSHEQAEQVQSPFYTTRTTRPVGLGVPLFKMAAEMTGGDFSIVSEENCGTRVRATFDASHIDMTPLGNVAETVLLLITCNPEIDFLYTRSRDANAIRLDTREMREILGGDVPLSSPDIALWMREYLREQEETLFQ